MSSCGPDASHVGEISHLHNCVFPNMKAAGSLQNVRVMPHVLVYCPVACLSGGH